MPAVTVADALAAFLAKQGVRRAYGVTGGEMLPVLDALQRHGVDFILTHHEAAAAYMADTEGQLTGRPGVCLSTLGPGAANLFAGLAQATLERSPVLGITADVTPDEAAGQRHQVYNIPGTMAPAVKYAARISPENIGTVLPAAWSAAARGMPGAAHLAVASSVATLPARSVPGSSENGWSITPAIPPAFAEVEQHLAHARQPVAVLGLEARTSAVAERFAQLVCHANIPVVTQVKARGWFPGNHRLHAGTLASYGSRGVFDLISSADLVLGVGLDGVDLIWPWDGPAGFNLTAYDVPDGSLPHAPIVGELAAMLERLAAASRPDHRADGAARAEAARQAARADLQAGPAGTDHPADAPSDGIPIDPLFQAIRAVAPTDTALISDVGMHKLYLAQYWDAPAPDTYFVANGLSGMGWALPSAISVKLTRPDQPALAVTGDGGALMFAGELGTLARLRPPGLVYLVLVDASLALIRLKAEQLEHDPMPNDFAPPDFVALARSFGLAAERVDSPAAAATVVRDGLTAAEPLVIEAPIDYGAYQRMT
ncbi:MAG: thiamine pyrophosphate-binding protein [Chloroflexi bacterium]|nr:thiamine pyrophosphate-binding protein [Chloroflexota bacterium]